jgi:hypothetical protein
MQAASLHAPEAQTHDVPPLDDWVPLEQFVAEHPNLGDANVQRWLLRYRATNGLASAVRKVGKRLLISKTRYAAWIAARDERAA